MRRNLVIAATFALLATGSAYLLTDGGSDPARDSKARVAADDPIDAVSSGTAPDDCELPEGRSTLADANLGFAWRSFKAIDATARTSGAPTTTYSPYSAVSAFQMLQNGADPGADRALLAAMCLRDVPIGELNEHARALRLALTKGDEVEVANAIWTSPKHTPTPRIDTIVRDQFGGEIGRFEFFEPGPLNEWITRKTKGRIPAMLKPDDLHSDMVMLLANAITFDGTWVDKFEDARPGPFTTASGAKVDVPTLRDQRQLDYVFSEPESDLMWAEEAKVRRQAPDAFHVVRIPYKGDRFAMMLVVPVLDDRLDEIIATLGPDRWRELRSGMQRTEVSLAMPKLKLQELRDIRDDLFQVGVPPKTYNRLVNETERPIEILYVKQGTFLELDEKGTKAAAATVIGAGVSAGGAVMGMPVVADHPYLLAIEDVQAGELLFISAIRELGGDKA